MMFALLAYLGGVLTVASPCILPVLPFVLARADRPFHSHGLPMLAGLALAFTATASLAAVGGGWAVQANEYGRVVALALLALFALALLWTPLADRLSRPLVRAGDRITSSMGGAFTLGLAAGLLWSPCAGPVLGLVLAGAALQGANVQSTALLLAYAAGAATALAAVLLAGGRIHGWLQRVLGVSHWLRRGAGVAVLAGVALIATGLDTRVLANVAASNTVNLENKLVGTLAPQASDRSAAQFEGAAAWINSTPLGAEDLRGKVVLVHFWTYSCINCLRTLPYVRAWADKYKDAGLRVVGVHSPEFAFEKNLDNVRRAVRDLQITYPVAVDSKHAIWRAFDNRAWPALYFIDARGRVRGEVLGEGQYAASERTIQKLLAESGSDRNAAGLVNVQGQGAEAAAGGVVASGETYLGYERTSGFVPSRGIAVGRSQLYTPATPRLNQWTLDGRWTVEAERAVADAASTRLGMRFRARDLHLVLGRDPGAGPIRFRILVDGKPPAAAHGADVDANGIGVIDAHRLYQLVRLPSPDAEHLFEIEFLDKGAHAYAFTFG
jgi:cytochrome c biogenesis protein CcdA/thiol-disulfide isomerase/thioredoxin